MDNQKAIPTQIEAEEAILGSIMFDSDSIGEINFLLPVDAFYLASHRQIYQACLDLYESDKITDLISVSDWLNSRHELENIGGMVKLSHLLNRTISASNLDRYANLVLEKYIRRRVIECGNKITNLGYDQTIELDSVLNDSENILFKCRPNEYDDFEPEEANEIAQELIAAAKTVGFQG